MRIAIISILLIVLFVPTAFAGEIYGSVELAGGPLKPGVEVEIVCPGSSRTTNTDEIGSYRLYMKETAMCTLTVKYGKEPFPSIQIYSYQSTVRYDLVLEANDGGRYSLRRR